MANMADGPDPAHQRPDGLDDLTVEALGKLSEALETVERVRGHLYSAHQLTGTADFMLDDAVSLFTDAGHPKLAERIERDLIGRNVTPGHWTFQLVEEYDDGYYADFKTIEKDARDELADGRRHLYEAELKEQRRSHGRPGHEAR
jgi:triacylglycerol esterase/lipase EstA (alpha/beta hydrolase family)